MADFINTIDLLGDEETAKAIVERTITEFNDNVISSIGKRAFEKCEKLVSFDLPNVTTVDDRAFLSCLALASVNLPSATSIGQYVFSSCRTLKSFDLPNVTTISSYAIQNCSSLESVNLPSLNTFPYYGVGYCTKLKSLDLPSLLNISYGAFYGCNALTTLILRSENICTLQGTNAFDGTPFAAGGTGGTVYVPSALISQYQNATNWSTLYAAGTCNFVAIEGSEYE